MQSLPRQGSLRPLFCVISTVACILARTHKRCALCSVLTCWQRHALAQRSSGSHFRVLSRKCSHVEHVVEQLSFAKLSRHELPIHCLPKTQEPSTLRSRHAPRCDGDVATDDVCLHPTSRQLKVGTMHELLCSVFSLARRWSSFSVERGRWLLSIIGVLPFVLPATGTSFVLCCSDTKSRCLFFLGNSIVWVLLLCVLARRLARGCCHGLGMAVFLLFLVEMAGCFRVFFFVWALHSSYFSLACRLLFLCLLVMARIPAWGYGYCNCEGLFWRHAVAVVPGAT